MNSKDKGNIAEAITLAEFTKRGIQVSIPYGDNARYDLVADFNGKLQRIQVKYCGQNTTNNSVTCHCSSSLNHTTNKHYTTYFNDIDYFVFYIASWDLCLLVPIEDIGTQKTFTIRKERAANGQNNGLHFAQQYSFDNLRV